MVLQFLWESRSDAFLREYRVITYGTSAALHEDIYITYGVEGFPHYMFVGEDGTILIRDCERPSSGKLIDQLKVFL